MDALTGLVYASPRDAVVDKAASMFQTAEGITRDEKKRSLSIVLSARLLRTLPTEAFGVIDDTAWQTIRAVVAGHHQRVALPG